MAFVQRFGIDGRDVGDVVSKVCSAYPGADFQVLLNEVWLRRSVPTATGLDPEGLEVQVLLRIRWRPPKWRQREL